MLASLILASPLLFLAGCSQMPTPVGTLTPGATATVTATVASTPGITPTPAGQPNLVIWLPPQFAPTPDSVAGAILQSRLDEFSASESGVRIQVRVKPADGPGGLLDTLTTASAAAPLALPDLIALPRPMLEAAALKGLLHPYNDLIANPDDSDWFEYARQLARLQDSLFGLPFAGDTLILVYRRQAIPEPPEALSPLPQVQGVLAFPAADPQALYTLNLYQAAGGAILDEDSRPSLNKEILTRVLAFYQQAATSELTPFWLTQFQNDDQSWDAFQKGQSDMVITWASRFLREQREQSTSYTAAPVPTLSGADFTLATGWVWAIASPLPERQKLAAQLAEFLSESKFLTQWTQATGYLPPRPSALESWGEARLHPLAEDISKSAQLYPSSDVLPSLALPLSEATIAMLKQQGEPNTAAERAVDSLLNP
jgi:ABC-type glycerol-3-phosphate transport system substrate-binding protein